MTGQDPEQTLESVNRRLSALLGREAPGLRGGGAAALEDTLWVWGVVGGKDVGKSSLINALAGSPIVETDETVGEGTFKPAAYLNRSDVPALQARWSSLEDLAVDYKAEAPATLRGLVLVDLPDLDSLFADHVDQVRRVTTLVDGLIWVTTPKKVADVRAIEEIRRVLKARTNFVYVVNKMDWLLGQSDRPTPQFLDRIRAGLQEQVTACDGDGPARSFLISARYCTAEGILEAVARSRHRGDGASSSETDPQLRQTAELLERDFGSLRTVLTTPPTDAAAGADKQANLTFQVRRQARLLLDHYRPQQVLRQVERALGPAAMAELVQRVFPPAYCAHVFRQHLTEGALLAEWSVTLFKRRLSYWSLLGVVAWPLTWLGTLLASLRGRLPAARTVDDPFRFDGIPLDDRVAGLTDKLQALLAGVGQPVDLRLPDRAQLVQQFRDDVRCETAEWRSACLQKYFNKRPTAAGRALRRALPLAVLIWFPALQPLLEGVLGVSDAGLLDAARVVVLTLSAHNVLLGLLAAFLILAVIAGAVYSGALRDTFAALDELKEASEGLACDAAIASVIGALSRPVDEFRAQVLEAGGTLERLLGNGEPQPGDR